MSTKPEITSRLVGDSNTVEIEAPKISLLEVIELDYIESEKIQPKVP